MAHQLAFGIDIGGSGIKGAPVDLKTGELVTDRIRIPTPQPSTPEAVALVVKDLVASFDLPKGMPVGVTFPAIIQHGVARSAANVDESWIGTDVDALLTEATGHDVFVVNDADAAGLAEVQFGAAHKRKGTVLLLTLGTGIGSALFIDGKLVPNTEFGHLRLPSGQESEKYAAESIRDYLELSWEDWAARLTTVFEHIEFLMSPDLIVLGGGISKKSDQFVPLIGVDIEIVAAKLRNNAGIVGAAVLAATAGTPKEMSKKDLKKAKKKAKKKKKKQKSKKK